MNELELPIDIHTNKLLDWLISRRHCNQDWQNNVLEIREKIKNAIQDMPATDEITQLLTGTYINYFHCVQIVELLKETESDTKSIFGRFSSQRMKDWQEIVNLYKKDNIYLAEAAQMLIRNVNYEVPSLKRQVSKLQQLRQEYERKSNECLKNASDLKDAYRSSCRQLEIEGDDIKKELIEQAKALPDTYESIVAQCRNLKQAKEYYVSFAEFVLGRKSGDELEKADTPLLTYVLEKGNTSVYEWKHGEKPLYVEEQNWELPSTESNQDCGAENDTIDFGDGGSIDFGDGQGKSSSVNDEVIDWEGGGEINFDISTQESDVIKTVPESVIGVARGEDALTILDNHRMRNLFINELYELEAFLEQRLLEMQVDNDLLSMNQFHSAPQIVQLQTGSSVAEMLDCLSAVLRRINDPTQTQQYLLIRESPRYVERLEGVLKQKLALAEKIIYRQQNLVKKLQDALVEEQGLAPKIDLIIRRTKELQKEIENDISKKYRNRPVNLMGGVNTL